MIEWLRTQAIRPVVEILLLIPAPLRYTAVVLLIVLCLVVIPIGLVPRLLAWVLTWIFQALRMMLAALEGLYAHKHMSSSALRSIDGFLDMLIVQLSRAIGKLQPIKQLPLRGWRPSKKLVFGLAIIPLALWFVAVPIRATALGRAISAGYTRIGQAEGWAMTGRWQVVEQADAPANPPAAAQTNRPEQPAASTGTQPGQSTAPNTSAANDPTYTVKKGDVLRKIAQQYNMSMRCIIQANQEQYPKFNPDSLKIGMQLRIPVNDPVCKP